ncbi:GntR family transcriptional regulator [Nesterenkonia flava]|uniref:GntR family transcriptional regulator n=1 Tax=Nesterenkonia flava TaxID=469799 RepID=A0ABU1FUF9_9MICC|nr:GntR family transcriptional regulator [Nesterenkonia flava]MDR5712296.1 GntR family transcriptional regulator [Nesterenkonia flava]
MSPAAVQPVSKAAAAYTSLRRSILTGELAPGQRVTLKELSELLGMSLTPVREALSRLVSEGYAVHDPHHGTFIAEQTAERIEQIYRLRGVLEPMAVRLAAERIAGLPEAELEGAAQLRDLLDRSASLTDPVARTELNVELHFALYRLSDDPLLLGFIEQLWAGMPYPSQRIYLDASQGEASRAEHQRVVEAVLAGDPDAADDEMSQHIERGREAALRRFHTT